jgi:hypothetical protein
MFSSMEDEMVQVRYTGIHDASAAFETLRPFRAKLMELQSRVRPFGSDFLILDAVRKALDTAAYHFTREPEFYTRRPGG